MDIISVNATIGCPTTHQDFAIYDIWPGTAPMCMCGTTKSLSNWRVGMDCEDESVAELTEGSL